MSLALGAAVAIVVAVLAGLSVVLFLALEKARRTSDALTERLSAAETELATVRQRSETLTGELGQLQSERERLEVLQATHLSLLNALPQPVWWRDGELKLKFCNDAYLRAVDLDREQVLREGVELVDSADRAAALALARQALDSRETRSGQFRVVAGGERCLLEVTERPLPDGTLVGFARDVTQVEALEADLARHTEASRTVVEKLGVGIAIYGADMHLSFHNAAYARIWHLDDDFLSAEPHLSDVLEQLRERRRLPEQADFADYKRQRVRQYERLIEPLEELLHLPDGATLRTTVHPHPFGGVVLTLEDVTDTLKLERTYNTLLEVQRETLDNLYEGVAVYGADGRLKLSNPAYARVWQLPEDFLDSRPHVRDVVGRSRDLFDVSDDSWPDYSEKPIARATEAQARSGRLERADGSVVDWAQVPLPDAASLFTFVDVTDTTRVERALRERNEALETTDRLKSEFIANISYELRTPLNAIIGFAEILENKYFGDLNERQMEYSHAIVDASQRLIALINDILDLASIEAGYMQLERREVDLYGLLTSAQKLWRERARSHGLDLVVDCDESIGQLNCDERRMTQALFNLLSNAFKFTPEGGVITLNAERRGEEVLLSVNDSGIGIPPQEQARVFGKFERGTNAESPDQGRQPGAGLGLSLVKSLIELHGGWIELRSAVGEGTQVTCHLPTSAAQVSAVLQPTHGASEPPSIH